jgi:hypothetical protein
VRKKIFSSVRVARVDAKWLADCACARTANAPEICFVLREEKLFGARVFFRYRAAHY